MQGIELLTKTEPLIIQQVRNMAISIKKAMETKLALLFYIISKKESINTLPKFFYYGKTNWLSNN
jgi:hypothetical protein